MQWCFRNISLTVVQVWPGNNKTSQQEKEGLLFFCQNIIPIRKAVSLPSSSLEFMLFQTSRVSYD